MSNNCSNCYNGCTEITSDKCVKYTGVDVPILGIKNGDSLSYVEQSIIGFLSSTLNGTGIIPIIAPSDVCPSVDNNLPDCDPISLNNWLTALLKSLCDLEQTVAAIPPVNPSAGYDLSCLLTPSDNTSTINVLQSVIYKVCDVAQQLNNFITFVDNTYVSISDINTYIENYLSSQPTEQLINKRMVPYSIVAAGGGALFLSNFNASGAGIGDWDRIFLCNGNNGTPDLRGRVLVGTNDGSMGGGTMSTAVDPSISGNPNYSIGAVHGINNVALTTGQLPAHSHANSATSTITPASHSHLLVSLGSSDVTDPPTASNQIKQFIETGGNLGYALRGTSSSATVGKSTEVTLSVTTVITNASTGGGEGHLNYQPGTGVYYIIYIP
jgi:microcystin-dependent protein